MFKEVEEVEAQVRELEYLLKKTRIKYEQFFMGNERREPTDMRGKIRTIIKKSDLGNHRRAAIRFRFMNLCQQYASLSSYWDRVLRMMEDGSFNYLAFRGFQPRVAESEAGRRARRAAEQGEPVERVVRLDPEEVEAEAVQMLASNWGENPPSVESPAPAADGALEALSASDVRVVASTTEAGATEPGADVDEGQEPAPPEAGEAGGFEASAAIERATRALEPTTAPTAEDVKSRLLLKRRRPQTPEELKRSAVKAGAATPPLDEAAAARPAPSPAASSSPPTAASKPVVPAPRPSKASDAVTATATKIAAQAAEVDREAREPAGEVLPGSRGLYDKYLSAKGSAYRDAEDEMSFGQFEKRLLRKRDTLKKKFQQDFEFDVVNRDGKVSIVARKR